MGKGDKVQYRRPKVPSFSGLSPASEAASHAKRSNTKTGTSHEVALRKELFRLGLRYRKNVATLPGTPDIVFPSAKVVVFCDGDFWHGRNWEALRSQLEQRHNAVYWIAKISRNRDRDREQERLLKEYGWLVLRFWETDIKKDPAAHARAIRDIVIARRELGKAPGPP